MAKGLLALIFALFFPAVLSAQKGAPIDVANIELLIAAHKKKHDRLKERRRSKAQCRHKDCTGRIREVRDGT